MSQNQPASSKSKYASKHPESKTPEAQRYGTTANDPTELDSPSDHVEPPFVGVQLRLVLVPNKICIAEHYHAITSNVFGTPTLYS